MSDVQSTEPMSPVALREIADCSPARCHDALEWAADEIERLQAIDREFHNIDDVVEITTLKREVASWKAVAHDHSERLKRIDEQRRERLAQLIPATSHESADDVPRDPAPRREQYEPGDYGTKCYEKALLEHSTRPREP